MSFMKKEEELSSSNDPKNTMKALVRQFNNFLQRDNERQERFDPRMVEVERRLQPIRQDRRRNDESEYEEFEGDDFDDEDEQEWVDNNMIYGG